MEYSAKVQVHATSPKYGDLSLLFNFVFDNESNCSTLQLPDGYIFGGQTSGCTSDGVRLASSMAYNSKMKLYSLNALTKLGAQHCIFYKVGDEQNKKTRFVCDLSFFAATIKNDIWQWRKTL